ncbi:hypothetical protein P4324_17020 [Bacillus thuringiensis]|uniref:hypothetical protein n=1 Tax=Bacillus thuringiensis TaxID=1428 RepID=UPI000BFC2BF0|nr:hypothetical protein [Bacillus thuringiensis]MED2920250.1 hypothetical protein [Bacillus thuringiensis]MED2923744.1 hypothetical protein [Bacillus thuringiensis]MED3051690.1 hypothetical protein [Bacillus thuringiensis]PGR86676.1 hypothetical protein COC68_31860 [Bacillus thuringiensis]
MVYEIKFIPYEELIFFEEYNEEQLIKIKSNIDAQKALSNLPIVMRIESNKYLVLDGTHRILALNKLRCMNITAQIIDESIVVCSSWLHQIPKCEELISDLKNNPNFYFTGENLLEQKYLARVYIDNQVYYLYDMDSKKKEEAISFLHSIINVYDSKYGYTKITKEEYTPNLEYITIEFPDFSIQEIMKSIDNKLLPLNVIRFTFNIKNMNGINIPIYVIRSPEAYEFEWREIIEKLSLPIQ